MAKNLEAYLRRLRLHSSKRNPWSKSDASNAEIGSAFAALTHAAADFVDAYRSHPAKSYAGAVAIMEGLVHTFPMAAKPADVESAVAELMRDLHGPHGEEAEEPERSTTDEND